MSDIDTAELRAYYGIDPDDDPPNRRDIHAHDLAAALDALDSAQAALRAATAERDRLCMETYRQTVRAEEAEAEIARWPSDWETRFPCDAFCADGPEEDCSRHGRTPPWLWGEIGKLVDRCSKAEAERDAALARLADAWDEGWYAGWSYGTETQHENPYRRGGEA